MFKLIKHIKLVLTHKKYVFLMCKNMGITLQGIVHDLSKFSPAELSISKYYTGKNSPQEECRRKNGYSKSWLHHKYHNKHHWQYWLDDDENGKFVPIKIPYKYVIEMFCDQVSASKTYLRDKFTAASPLEYYKDKCEGKRIMNEQSECLLTMLLQSYSSFDNEDEFFDWYLQIKSKVELAYLREASDYAIVDSKSENKFFYAGEFI